LNKAKEILSYQVGGLLYSPASNEAIAEKIINKEIPFLTSVALCLEDSISDDAVDEAEQTLAGILKTVSKSGADDLPLIFVRVRNAEHLLRVHDIISDYTDILTGYIFPKFDNTNAENYIAGFRKILESSDKTFYFMPIIESRAVADKITRFQNLSEIKMMLDNIKDNVLNVRVGGNDFCQLYGLRRSISQTIYDMDVIRDILADIINFFANDYVVSGAVWEYFDSGTDSLWAEGLKRELELDILNGFTGKTSIHPSQLPVIYECLKVHKSDYDDAVRIIGWNNSSLGVEKNSDGNRMNEVKCHIKWARKIKMLGDIYGIKEAENNEQHIRKK